MLSRFSALVLLLCSAQAFCQQTGYYRTPSLRQNTVVFTAEGDLWKYDVKTSAATRLTTNPGLETYPVISPDGLQLVFTAQYEGPNDLYLMPVNGGVPRRLTYDLGKSTYAVGWTKDGKILVSSEANTALPSPQIVVLDPATLTRTVIPLWQANFAAYDDAGILYFTRFPNQGSKTKRYKGGLIEQIWKFDGNSEAVNLTAGFDGTSTSPMYYSGRIYFLSDRDGTMNLWSMNLSGNDLKQQTFSKGWDLQYPAVDGGSIIYQKGADLWIYDIAANQERMLDIKLTSDFDQRKPKWIKGPANSISASTISPNGNYAAIISRGRVFVSPARSDRWIELTRKSGIRFRDLRFINNKSLAVLSDASGEFEVWKMNADGSDSATQVTRNSKTLITQFSFSPDEKLIAYGDKNEVIRIADAATGAIRYSYDSAYAALQEFNWSPDSRFFSFSETLSNENTQLNLVDCKSMKKFAISTARLNSNNLNWSADGNWIWFTSDRNLQTKVRAPWGARQPEPYYDQVTNIYAMAVDSGARFPFLTSDTWLSDSIFNAQPVKPDPKKPKPAIAAATRVYDWAQIRHRLYTLPIPSANIVQLVVADGYLYWLAIEDLQSDNFGKLYALKIEESKKYEPTEVASRVTGFELSGNRKKLLVTYAGNTMGIADANGQKIDAEKTGMKLENWSFLVDPQLEWKEMFDDAWIMMRDYFYDQEMHKVNWVSIRKQYEPLLTRITDRYELDDVLAQMVGELSALHTFVGGGDKRLSPDMIPTGFLGGSFSKVATGLRIDHIYQSDPDYPDYSSPLNKPELRIREGDIIVSVNNTPLSEVADISELLANKISIPVKLTLTNAAGKSYQQIVTPCSARDAYTLRYEEWEYQNRLKVDTMGQDDIGYVHLKAMGSTDMDAFVKQYYPVFTRKGLIIDVRQNFGGNIDSWILEKLMRKVWMYWQARSGKPYWNMQYAFRGHMVILCDQGTSSDGEAVSEGFRRLGLGKVIGMRTWGGEIWLSSRNRMVDNGIASAAEFGVFNDGKWLIEGRGVEPDIEVDNLPFATFKGKDAQLEFCVEYLKKLIKEKPVDAPVAPPHPDKSFDYKSRF